MAASLIRDRLLHRTTTGSRTRRRIISGPLLECLEERALMSVTFQETPEPSAGTTALLITDTVKNDSLSINDNGTGAAGNIFVSSGDGQDYMSTGGVIELAVVTGKGTDRVTYELDSNLQANVRQFVEVGSAKKGGGSVVFTVNVVGKVLDQANLLAIASSTHYKRATMTVNDSGEIDGSFTAGIESSELKAKGTSPEIFTFNSSAKIGADGQVSTGLIGSTKNDIGSVSYSGTNDGELDITELGEGGNDQFFADVYMAPGSTGTVGSSHQASFIETSGKRDRLRFTIFQGTDSTTTTNIYAELLDGSKNDVSTHTANVMAVTKGSDLIVS